MTTIADLQAAGRELATLLEEHREKIGSAAVDRALQRWMVANWGARERPQPADLDIREAIQDHHAQTARRCPGGDYPYRAGWDAAIRLVYGDLGEGKRA